MITIPLQFGMAISKLLGFLFVLISYTRKPQALERLHPPPATPSHCLSLGKLVEIVRFTVFFLIFCIFMLGNVVLPLFTGV